MGLSTEELQLLIRARNLSGPALAELQGQLATTTRAISASNARLNTIANASGRIGAAMTRYITLPVVGIGVASAVMASRFEASMKLIQTQAGGSAADVKTLSAQVLTLATHAQQGPDALAKALYHLKSVGMNNVQAMSALKMASQGAAVGQANLEDVTNALAGAWKSGIVGAKSFKDAMSTVNAIVGAGNMRMTDLVAALGTGILPAAKTFGVSFKSVGAALALFTDEGMPAAQSATRLRMAISLMGAPTDKAAKLLKTIGLNSTDLAKDLRSGGIVKAVGDLKDHLEGLSKIKQSQILAGAFGGARSGTAIMALVNGYDALVKKQEQITTNAGKFGAAVAAQAQTSEAKFHHLVAVLETDGVKIGNTLMPVALEVAGDVQKLVDAFGKLPGSTQKAIIEFALLAAALGPVLKMTSTTIKAFTTLRALMIGGKTAQAALGASGAASGAAGAGAGFAKTGGKFIPWGYTPAAAPVVAGAGGEAAAGASMGATFAAVAAPILAGVIAGAIVQHMAGPSQLPANVQQAQLRQGRTVTQTRGTASYIAPNSPAIEKVIAQLNVKGATASMGELKNILAEVKALQAMAKDPIILGKLQGKQTEASARNLRDTLIHEFKLTKAQANAVVSQLLHVKVTDYVTPQMTRTQKAVAAKLAAIRADLAKPSKMTAPQTAGVIAALDRIIAACGGVASAAGNAAAKLAALASGRSSQFAHGTMGGLAMGGLAVGPSSGYSQLLHGTELVLPTDNPARARALLSQHYGKLGIGAGPSSASAISGGTSGSPTHLVSGTVQVDVVMDGRTVGHAAAPYVTEAQARDSRIAARGHVR